MTDQVFECKTCGEPIGDRQSKNVVWLCYRKDGEWCRTCFDRKPCGMGKHGLGCPAQMICTPVDVTLPNSNPDVRT